MDEIDHNWINKSARISCPNLTYLEYETVIDKLENASTRTLVSLDEARTLFALSAIINDLHIKIVYDFWHERRTTTRVHHFLSIILIHKTRRKGKKSRSGDILLHFSYFFFCSSFIKHN
jgi:hypothetical protein